MRGCGPHFQEFPQNATSDVAGDRNERCGPSAFALHWHCTFMSSAPSVFHSIDLPDHFITIIDRIKAPRRAFGNDSVAELTEQSQNVVYLVPYEIMDRPCWGRLRVQLATTSRLFIVCVEKVRTADVARSLRDGASDVLSTEDDDERWKGAIMKAAEGQRVWVQLYGGKPLSAEDILIGRSESILRLRQTIDRLGPTDVCVLIQGESGVGKERVAAALHKAGRGKTFVALNCAAIPKDLLEAELFGVEKGAFTGALKARPGLVEQAHGGTLFLDEIGEMELGVQPKLLRFLETRKARRVGGEQEYSVKVRVISATNRNLDVEVEEKRFRADLYYRLAEIILHASPLRTRPEDIPELAIAFLHNANERFGKGFLTIEPGLIEKFQRHTWPGNVRELKSTVDRLALLFDGPVMREPWWDVPEPRLSAFVPRPIGEAVSSPPRNISPDMGEWVSRPPAAAEPPVQGGYMQNTGVLNQKQRLALASRLLQESDDNYSWVAGQLGINTSTLWRWRKAGKLG